MYLLMVYADDNVLMGSDYNDNSKVKKNVKTYFFIKDMGKPRYFWVLVFSPSGHDSNFPIQICVEHALEN